ncbi:MAG: DUF86 domain-containing protein [Methanosarcinaceae archaeon]|nr:DUF86 domain-containing protein [Methanosarcinaceae archaeon]
MSAENKILRKLNFMQKCVGYLKSIDTDSNNLDMNYGLRSAVERNFQLAIESAIDIGEIIISEKGFERPEDYRSVFLILGKQGIIPMDFAEDFSVAAGFRNVLVHIYEEVDSSLLDVFLNERLDDFDRFARHIATYISNNS